ncbi:hypothetical protein ACRAVF_26980 [Bradyrhizobium oligotrophicum S58]
MSKTDYIDDEDEAVTTAEARADAFESDTAFVAAMAKAIRRKRETATFGVYVDPTPPVNARRIIAPATRSYISSPGAACEEIGKRSRSQG